MRGAHPLATPAAILLATVLIGMSVPGNAWHVDDPPALLHSGGGPGEGWVMYKFDPAGEHVVIDLEVPTLSGTPIVQLAAMFYNENLALQFGFAFTGYFAQDGVRVETDVLGDEEPIVDTYDEWSSAGFSAMGTEINPPGSPFDPVSGTMYVALWAVGGIGEHSHAIHGANGVQLEAVEEGTSATLYVTEDFGGTVNARASAGPVGVRALVDGEIEHTVEGTMLGLFSSGFIAPTTDVLSVEKPDGTTQDCFCFWTQVSGPRSNGPGDYTFRASGTTATLNGGEHVRVSVVDVQVPG